VGDPVYLDCNATTPMEPAVAEIVCRYMVDEFGNAGSRTHEFGARAKRAVEHARRQVAEVVRAEPSEVAFTSGATESNNLALLGLRQAGEDSGRRHIVSTQIEHKAVLEPLSYLATQGFEIDLVPPNRGGWVEPSAIAEVLRPDSLLVSVMHVNNETGVEQPLEEICALLADHPAFLHTDAAQGFGKRLEPLRHPRLDLISISGHKIYGPKGVGALIVRRRRGERPPLQPLLLGGGQEGGLRAGTLPVALLAGLGVAADLSTKENDRRSRSCLETKGFIVASLEKLDIQVFGDPERTLPSVLTFGLHGLDSEAAMLAMKDLVAVSNGSACTSTLYEPSHVLMAMGYSEEEVLTAVRWSWCHQTPLPDVGETARVLATLL